MPKRSPEQKFNSFAAGFKTSAKGTLWRKYDEDIVSVFKYQGGWKWCVANNEADVRYFSQEVFEVEIDAMVSLARECCVFL